MVSKKRLLLFAGSIASIGAVVALATGVTFGLFSTAGSSQTNTFTAGTVSLNNTATHTCTVAPMAPGDGTVAPGAPVAGRGEVQCVFDVSYTGNVPAYLGLDVAVKSTTAGTDPDSILTGAQGLYDGKQGNNASDSGLQILVNDASGTIIGSASNATGTSYTVDGDATPFTNTLAGPATGSTTTQSDFLLSSTPYSPTGTHTDSITVDYNLPLGADNSYQGAASTIKLTVHAVQADHNSTACATNSQCSTLVWG